MPSAETLGCFVHKVRISFVMVTRRGARRLSLRRRFAENSAGLRAAMLDRERPLSQSGSGRAEATLKMAAG